MIPRKLILHNAIGIKKGIGKDEIEIDFTKFDKGIIGIFGATGSGKTTILDNLTPYRRLATREGSLYSQYYGQGVKEFEFSIGEDIYLSKIIIDTERRKMIPTLFKNGDPITDKSDEYDAKIISILGDYDIFINSVFNPQNGTGVIDMRDSERKSLFMRLFNITIYENKYIPYIKDKLSKLDTRISAARIVQEEMERDVDILSSYKYELNEIKGSIPDLELEVEHSNIRLGKHIEGINNISNNISKAETEDELVINLKRELNTIYLNTGQIKKEGIEQAKDTEQMIENNEEDIGLAEKNIEKLKKDIERSNKIINNKDKIIEKTRLLDVLEKRLLELEKERDALIEHNNKLNILNNEVLNDSNDSKILRNKEVPCIGTDFETTCPLLSKARKAYSGLDDKIVKRNKLEDKVKKLKDKYNWDAVVEEIEEIRKEGWATLKTELDHCEDELQKLLNRLKEEELYLYKCIDIKKILSAKLLKIEKTVESKIDKNKKREEVLEQKLSDYRKDSNIEDMKKELANLKFMQDKMESAVNIARHNLSTAQTKIVEFEKQVILFDRKEKAVADKKSEIKKWLKDFEEWKLMEKACKEIPVFMLENLALVVTDKANELLKNRMNNNISIKIVTVLPKSVKGYKDVFKIMVFNDGDEVLANNLSGGQKALIDASLRMAIEASLSETSSIKYDSLFWDEGDRAWDNNISLMFLEMLQTAQKWGDKAYTFLISHRSQIQDNVHQKIIMEQI